MRRAVGAFIDEPVALIAGELALLAAIVLVALAWALAPAAVILAPLVALPGSALMRLATVAVEDGVPTWRTALAEARRRVGRKLLIAAVQSVITLLGVVNILLSGSIGGLIGGVSAAIAGYVLLVVWTLSLALWPILSDPRRDAPLGRQLRLAVAIVLTKPLGLLVVLALAVGSAIVCVQLIAPSIVLPALVFLTLAAYVGPLVDRLEPAGSGAGD